MTTAGLKSLRIRLAPEIPFTVAIRLRNRAPQPTPLRLPAGRQRSGKPSCGTNLASIPCSAPTKRTSAVLSRRRISRATAIPGKRCPPVPPPAIIARILPRSGHKQSWENRCQTTCFPFSCGKRETGGLAPIFPALLFYPDRSPCCDTFNRMPTDASITTKELPP
jgi:hypothetical protein